MLIFLLVEVSVVDICKVNEHQSSKEDRDVSVENSFFHVTSGLEITFFAILVLNATKIPVYNPHSVKQIHES